PAFDPQMPAKVERIHETYESRHLDGAFLVFAATDNAEVNNQVVRDARARKQLVNRADADDDEPGDRRRVCAAAAAECVGQLGEGGAAPARAAAPASARQRASAARRPAPCSRTRPRRGQRAKAGAGAPAPSSRPGGRPAPDERPRA
ncbi:NAD(P)-dependent oxidoreductase, partial [Lacticaseibacillus rhamnosus]